MNFKSLLLSNRIFMLILLILLFPLFALATSESGSTFYKDFDNDGFGDPNSYTISEAIPDGYVDNNLDCDDNNNEINPDASEACNGLDDNCNGNADEEIGTMWYADSDSDGFGVENNSMLACNQPEGFAAKAGDCDDTNNEINPDASEACNRLDDNCDGEIDEGVENIWYIDNDNDSFGNPEVFVMSCEALEGYVKNDLDCNDEDSLINPDAEEINNGIDDNCNGDIDETEEDLSKYCKYSLFPDVQRFSFGKFSYRIKIYNNLENPAGLIKINPPRHHYSKDGAFEIFIDDVAVELFEDSELTNSIGTKYYYKADDRRTYIWFKLNFTNDSKIVLKHYEDSEIPIYEVDWTVVVYCPSCADLIKVNPVKPHKIEKGLWWNYSSPTVVYIDSGKENRKIMVTSPARCDWTAESMVSWITIVSGEYGNGDGVIEYQIEENVELSERSGLIRIKTNDELIESLTIKQKTKEIEDIWVYKCSDNCNGEITDELIEQFGNSNEYIVNENENLNFAVLIKYSDDTYINLNNDDNLVWAVNKPYYAQIDETGTFTTKNISRGNKTVKITAIYRYNNKIVRDNTTVKIINNTELISLNIVGSDTINEWSSKYYKAIAKWSDNPDTNVTNITDWSLDSDQYASIIRGSLESKLVAGNKNVVIKASFEHNGTIVKAEKEVVIKDKSILDYIEIKGNSSVKEGESSKYQAIAVWKYSFWFFRPYEEPTDVTNNVIWNVNLNEFASIDPDGTLTALNVPDDQTIQIQAIYSHNGDNYNTTKDIAIINTMEWTLAITGQDSINENETANYNAVYMGIDGNEINVTSNCNWNLSSEIVSVNQGEIVVGSLNNGNQAINLEACYNVDGQIKCAAKQIELIDTTIATALNINYPEVINEGSSHLLKAFVIWSNEEPTEVTEQIEWIIESPYLTIDNTGRLNAESVDEDQEVNFSAKFVHNDKELIQDLNITIKDALQPESIYIVGPDSVEETTSTEFILIASWANGITQKVHADNWSVSDYAFITNGFLVANEVDQDQQATIKASYLDQEAVHVITIMDNKAPFFISGNISYEGSETGRLVLEAFSISDQAFTETLYFISFEWNLETENVFYELFVNSGITYKLRAYIDTNNNELLDKCEPKGVFPDSEEGISKESLDSNFTISTPENCSDAGAALDMDLTTWQYDSFISTTHIEAIGTPDENNEILVAIVAQNVSDLDTYQVEVKYDPNVLSFEGGYEDDFQPDVNFLKSNGGSTLGFQASSNNGIVHVVSSLIGKDTLEAPDGSGIITILKFKQIVESNDKNLSLNNVHFIDSIGKDESIINLLNGVIKGDICENMPPWDFNMDGIIDYKDLNLFADNWLITENDSDWEFASIYNVSETPDFESGLQIIDYQDLIILAKHWLETSSCSQSDY